MPRVPLCLAGRYRDPICLAMGEGHPYDSAQHLAGEADRYQRARGHGTHPALRRLRLPLRGHLEVPPPRRTGHRPVRQGRHPRPRLLRTPRRLLRDRLRPADPGGAAHPARRHPHDREHARRVADHQAADPVGRRPLFAGKSGWWDFAHESRTDLAQLCGSLLLLLVGAGAFSLDARLARTAGTPAAAPVRRPADPPDYGASSPRTSRASSFSACRSSARACFPASVAL